MLRRTNVSRFASVGATLGKGGDFKCIRVEPSLSDLADPEGVPMQGSLWESASTGTRVIFFNAKERQTSPTAASASETSLAATVTDAGEKACAIAFCTPAENDSGATHILEHTVLCGSEKFPTVRDPFFKMLRRSLSTFMNAMTSPSHTVYPFSTVNERDFFNILEVYLDCTLHPLIRPQDFSQEAHRLKVDAPQAPCDTLQRTGVVLNEMKGAMSDPLTFFYTEQSKHAFAGTNYSKCFGGAPAAIPEITHADLVSYYRRHYQKPVVALFDSSVAGQGSKREFLEKTLDKILTEVTTPRKVLLEAEQQQPQKNDSQEKSALERLRDLRLAGTPTTMIPGQAQFSFSWGPADPMQQVGDDATTTSRLSFYRPLKDLVVDKVAATRDDHRKMFEANVLMHILLRPPSGPLYRELLHNADNTSAMSSLDVAVVEKRIAELELEVGLTAEEAATLRAHKEDKRKLKEEQDKIKQENEQNGGGGGGSTIDLLPGCGIDTSVQTPGLFVGLQNVPAFADSDDAAASETATQRNAALSQLKTHLVSLIALSTLKSVAGTGLDSGLVSSALHEYELALRTRSGTFAVRAAISSTGAFISGRDPFWVHDDTAIDTEIAAALKPTIADRSKHTFFFTELIQSQLLFENTRRHEDPVIKTTAVAGSNHSVKRDAAAEAKALEELKKKMAAPESAEKLKAVYESEQKLLEAQKRVDDGASLPTLEISDIAREPVNFTPPSHSISSRPSSSSNRNNTAEEIKSASQPVQSFVTNTAGLAYVRLLLPLHDTHESLITTFGNNSATHVMLPLFTFLLDKMGTEEMSIAMQDVAVRSVCSGFSCGITLASLPTTEQNQQTNSFSAVRALQVNFHAMPENVPAALELLGAALKANLAAKWWNLVAADPERRAMLIQLLTMYASEAESSVMHSGTAFAASEALLGAAVMGNGSSSSSVASSVLHDYGVWNGLESITKLTQIRSAISDLQQAQKDPFDAISFLFTGFEKIAQRTLCNNADATGYCVAGPDHHVAVTEHINNFLNKNIRGGSAKNESGQDSLITTEPRLFHLNAAQIQTATEQAVSSLVLHRPLQGASTTFVGCVLPTALHSEHPLTGAFQLALRIASQEFLHREIREIGGAYGSGGKVGAGDFGSSSGLVTFSSYRDPSPERTISIFRDGAIRDWFRSSPPDARMLREAKLSIFGAVDAPVPPHNVGERTAVNRVGRELLAKQRQRLLNATLDDVVRSVEEFLDPEFTKRAMTCCVVGKTEKK